jgi:excinuclease UvrABC nuclease subunit
MHPLFAAVTESLHPSFEKLILQAPLREARFPKEFPKRGVYLFSESDRHLYVGRSNTLRGRYGRHCNPGASHRMAAFAFKLAREKTGKIKASYKAGAESRAGLMENLEFKDAFVTAKRRIRLMDYRWVEETDPVKQCLLEVYCAVVLQTKYNDFDNH